MVQSVHVKTRLLLKAVHALSHGQPVRALPVGNGPVNEVKFLGLPKEVVKTNKIVR